MDCPPVLVTSALPVRPVRVIRPERTLKPANRENAQGAFESSFEESIEVDGSSWVAVRCFEERSSGRVRFAHTGPFHIEVEGSPLRPRRVEVEFLIRRVRDEIKRSTGVLPPAAIAEYRRALAVYEEKLDSAR